MKNIVMFVLGFVTGCVLVFLYEHIVSKQRAEAFLSDDEIFDDDGEEHSSVNVSDKMIQKD